MYFDRFDICSAYYLYFTQYHSGQGSCLYKRLCKLLKYYKPSFSVQEGLLNENAQVIYDDLVDKFHKYAPKDY